MTSWGQLGAIAGLSPRAVQPTMGICPLARVPRAEVYQELMASSCHRVELQQLQAIVFQEVTLSVVLVAAAPVERHLQTLQGQHQGHKTVVPEFLMVRQVRHRLHGVVFQFSASTNFMPVEVLV
mmetsp:Transcript_38824/g.91314  ORF Transcript_38824/g.91314 Transcript_38824/m.91314 type:complete len:124 (+) Transcript_38824:748-1119(+)